MVPSSMPLARRRVSDPAALKALAHPLRVALLEVLVTDGPLTASQASAKVAASPSNCSWHLRKLAEHGFVRETRGRTGRQRPWQAVSEGLAWLDDRSAEAADPSTRLAAEAVGDMLVERELQRLRAARAARESEPAEWREATGLVRAQLWLNAAEAQLLKETLSELVSGPGARDNDQQGHPADARPVSLVAWLVPSGPTTR